MTWGMLGPSEALHQYADCDKVYVSAWFLSHLPGGVTVDWSRGAPNCHVVTRTHQPCHEQCMKDVLLKLHHPRRVWRFTGEALTHDYSNGARHLLGYEAVWPD